MKLAHLLILVVIANAATAANILGLFTSPGRSHLIVFMSVAKALVDKGHNLTVVTTIPIPNAERNPSYRHILLERNDGADKELSRQVSALVKETSIANFLSAMRTLSAAQRDALSHGKFLDFLEEGNSFDLMLLGYFGNEYQLGVAAHFDCPVAVINLGPSIGTVNAFVGNPEAIAYVPNPFLGNIQPMSFVQRVFNFGLASAQSLLQLYLDNLMNEIYNEHFPSEKYPPLSALKRNISVVLCNHHFSEGPVKPNVPGMVEIGGIQIKESPSPLPQNIANFLNASPNGAILFSLGSTAKSVDLNPNTLQQMYNVLARLDENVILKWDGEVPHDHPPNMLFSKWLPQDDILAHNNTKLFITHGGKGSTVESQFHGVPMLVIPLFGDQPTNSKEIEAKGYGLTLNHLTLAEEAFEVALRRVLDIRTFSENVRKFSKLYRDRPLTAKQNAVYWLEYVIRQKGALHMQSPLVHMSYIQSSSLDVVLFLVLVLTVVVYSFKYFIRFMCMKCFSNKIKAD